jgi:hypothetical protein
MKKSVTYVWEESDIKPGLQVFGHESNRLVVHVGTYQTSFAFDLVDVETGYFSGFHHSAKEITKRFNEFGFKPGWDLAKIQVKGADDA